MHQICRLNNIVTHLNINIVLYGNFFEDNATEET